MSRFLTTTERAAALDDLRTTVPNPDALEALIDAEVDARVKAHLDAQARGVDSPYDSPEERDKRRKRGIIATFTAEPGALEAFMEALRPPPEHFDVDEIQKLWIDVSLGYPEAAAKAGPLALKHIGFLLGRAQELSEQLLRAHEEGFRP